MFKKKLNAISIIFDSRKIRKGNKWCWTKVNRNEHVEEILNKIIDWPEHETYLRR